MEITAVSAHPWEGDPLHGFSEDLGNKNDSEGPVSGVGFELRSKNSYRNFAGTLVQLT
jgi:hypothetical protein